MPETGAAGSRMFARELDGLSVAVDDCSRRPRRELRALMLRETYAAHGLAGRAGTADAGACMPMLGGAKFWYTGEKLADPLRPAADGGRLLTRL